MARPASNRSPKRYFRDSAVRLAILVYCGALSGAANAGLGTLVEWLLLSGLPVPIQADPSGQFYRPMALHPVGYSIFHTRLLVESAYPGLFWGALGGLLTAVVGLYWKGVKSLWGATLFWAGLSACFFCALRALSDLDQGGGPDVSWSGTAGLMLLAAGIGAAYGGVLALLVRAADSLHGLASWPEQPTDVAS